MEDGVEGQRRGSGWRSRRVIVPAAVLAGAGIWCARFAVSFGAADLVEA